MRANANEVLAQELRKPLLKSLKEGNSMPGSKIFGQQT